MLPAISHNASSGVRENTRFGMHVYESGAESSPVILFLHGSPLSGRMWLPQLERLPEFHCLAPDLPEHGRSAGPFEMKDTVDRLAALIRTAHPDAAPKDARAHVVGLSFGGVVAQALLVHAPEVVDHALLSGTSARLGETLLALLRLQVNLNRPLLRWLPPKWVAALVRGQFGIPSEYQAMLEEDMLKVPAGDMLRFLLESYSRIETPSKTTSPVLVVVGAKETPVAKRMARQLLRTLPQAKGVHVPGLGHVWNLQAPALFADTVRTWVSDQPLPSTLEPLGAHE